MRLHAAILALGLAAGCGHSTGASALPYKPQVAGLISVPDPNHLVGPPYVAPWVTKPAPLTITKVAGDGPCQVGHATTLVVDLTYGNGAPAAGQCVLFSPEHVGVFLGLGSASTDANGRAQVSATPTMPGPWTVTVTASDGTLAAIETFTITGGP